MCREAVPACGKCVLHHSSRINIQQAVAFWDKCDGTSYLDLLAGVQVDGEVDELRVLGDKVPERALLQQILGLLLQVQGHDGAPAHLMLLPAGILCGGMGLRLSTWVGRAGVCGKQTRQAVCIPVVSRSPCLYAYRRTQHK